MLVDSDAIATIAVKDLKVARHFYGEKLGLKERPDSDIPGVVTYQSGGSKVLLYQSQYAGTNRATIATWAAQDLEAVVRTLAGKGVTFEHYDLPELTREGDIHSARDFKVVWFKDPDGNILSVNSTPVR